MEYTLYRLEKIEITFEHYWPINFNLYQPTFTYFKFYAMSYLI